MNTLLISVVICSHNPRQDYLSRTIDGLRCQTLDQASWELLLVDNRSEISLESWLNLNWHPNAQIVREDTLGLTPARLRGIRESRGELLIFVDDDNVLDPDFLEVALRVSNERPFLGSWSGQCRPIFEVDPPEWTRRYWGNLVIREFEEDHWSNLPRLAETMPCGAGLCVRRKVAQFYFQLDESKKRTFQLDRTGNSLVSGGDGDLAACACDLGLGVGLVAALKLQHLIPPGRLTVDYLSRLSEGIYFSAVLLDGIRGKKSQVDQWRVRWTDWIRALFCRGADRTIRLATLRGRRRGVEWVRRNLKVGCE